MTRKILFIFTALLSLIIFSSNSGGRSTGTTGAPGETGVTCAGCHFGGSFNPDMEVLLYDTEGAQVSSYKPGQEYTVEVKVNARMGSPSRYGFQALSLKDQDNTNAGQFTEPGQRVRTFTSMNRQYIVQSSASNSNTFTAKWTAPAEGTGAVSFYAAGIAANGNSNTTGDSPVNDKFTFSEDATSSTDFLQEEEAIVVFPNPALNFIQFSHTHNISHIVIYDTKGAKVLETMNNGNFLDIGSLGSGIYIIRFVSFDNQSQIHRFVKL
jgi:hypothetical protein